MAYIVKKCGVYYVRWREGGRGSPVRARRVGSKKGDAVRIKVEVEARLLAGRVGAGVIPERITFREWADRWLAMRTTRPKTQDRDRRLVRAHLDPAFGGRPLTSITTEDVATMDALLVRQVSSWTARRAHAVLRKMLGDARKAGYIRDNPAADVQAPPMPHVERRLPTLEQFSALLEEIPAGGWRALTLTLALLGCRWGEATALEWPDFAHDMTRVRIVRQVPANTLTVSAPKSASGRRVVEVPGPLRAALMDLPQRGELVFPAASGGYLNHRWWSKAVWRPAVRSAGLDGLRPHDLRHLNASWRVWWGEPVTLVAQELGHSSAAFTLRQYAWCLEEGRTLDRETVLEKVRAAYSAGRPVQRPARAIAETQNGIRGTR